MGLTVPILWSWNVGTPHTAYFTTVYIPLNLTQCLSLQSWDGGGRRAQKLLSLIPIQRSSRLSTLVRTSQWWSKGCSSALCLSGVRGEGWAQVFFSYLPAVLGCLSTWCWSRALQPGFHRDWMRLHLVKGDNGLGEDKRREDMIMLWKHFKSHLSVRTVVSKCLTHP